MLELYYTLQSAPCRAALLTASALDVEIKKNVLSLRNKEHLRPEFVSINPQHTVPTLVDGDLSLWESRAICTYLANKFDKTGTLYPDEPRKRAIIDRLLYFDSTLFNRFREYIRPIAFKGEKPNLAKLEDVQESLKFFDHFLEGNQWSAGDHITVADHTLVATVSTMVESGVDISSHPHVAVWLGRCCCQMPGYEENHEGALGYGAFVKQGVEKSQQK